MSYLPINVSTLRPNQSFSFDLYIQVNHKHILYVRSGDDIDTDRLSKLIKANTDRIFILTDQLLKYQKFIEAEINEAIQSESMPLDRKSEIVENAAINAIDALEACFQQEELDPFSETAFNMAMNAAKGLRAVIQKNPDALKKIFFQKGRNHDLILQHSKNVCALSVRFAFLMGFKGEDLDNLGAAALIHDIGLNKLQQQEMNILFKRPPEMFNGEERRFYNFHPTDGQTMLKSKPFINDTILRLVLRHEENCAGKGFPNRHPITDPLEEILSLCNLFDKKVTVFGIDPMKAYKEFLKYEIGNYNLETLKKFKDVLTKEGILNY